MRWWHWVPLAIVSVALVAVVSVQYFLGLLQARAWEEGSIRVTIEHFLLERGARLSTRMKPGDDNNVQVFATEMANWSRLAFDELCKDNVEFVSAECNGEIVVTYRHKGDTYVVKHGITDVASNGGENATPK